MSLQYFPLFLPALFFFSLPILYSIYQDDATKTQKEYLARKRAAAKKEGKPAPVQAETIRPEKKEDAAPPSGAQLETTPRRKRGRPRKKPEHAPDPPTTCTLEEFARFYISA